MGQRLRAVYRSPPPPQGEAGMGVRRAVYRWRALGGRFRGWGRRRESRRGFGPQQRSYGEMRRGQGPRGGESEKGGEGKGRGRGRPRAAGHGVRCPRLPTPPLALSSCSTLLALPSWILPRNLPKVNRRAAPGALPLHAPQRTSAPRAPITLLSLPRCKTCPCTQTQEVSEPTEDGGRRARDRSSTGLGKGRSRRGRGKGRGRRRGRSRSRRRAGVGGGGDPGVVSSEAVVRMCGSPALAQPLCLSPNAVCVTSFSGGRTRRRGVPVSLRISLVPHTAPFGLDSWQRYLSDRYCTVLRCSAVPGTRRCVYSTVAGLLLLCCGHPLLLKLLHHLLVSGLLLQSQPQAVEKTRRVGPTNHRALPGLPLPAPLPVPVLWQGGACPGVRSRLVGHRGVPGGGLRLPTRYSLTAQARPAQARHLLTVPCRTQPPPASHNANVLSMSLCLECVTVAKV